MLEYVEFGDCEVKTIQIAKTQYSIRNDLPQQYKFSKNKIGIGTSYDGSKLFTSIPGASRFILVSTHLDRYEVFHFLVDRHNHLQNQALEACKTENVAHEDSIPVAKNQQ